MHIPAQRLCSLTGMSMAVHYGPIRWIGESVVPVRGHRRPLVAGAITLTALWLSEWVKSKVSLRTVCAPLFAQWIMMSDTQHRSNTGSSSQIVIDGRIVQSGRCNGVALGNIVPSVGDIRTTFDQPSRPTRSMSLRRITTRFSPRTDRWQLGNFDRWPVKKVSGIRSRWRAK